MSDGGLIEQWERMLQPVQQKPQGTLRVGLTTDGLVYMQFPEPMKEVDLTPEQATSLARLLREQAGRAKPAIDVTPEQRKNDLSHDLPLIVDGTATPTDGVSRDGEEKREET